MSIDEIISEIPDLEFGPDFAFRTANGFILVHILADADDGTIPQWLETAGANALQRPNIDLILLAPPGDDNRSPLIACRIMDRARQLGFGVGCCTPVGARLVLPPRIGPETPYAGEQELGHIPRWILAELSNCSFSEHLASALTEFTGEYDKITDASSPALHKEPDLLIALAQRIATGDERLFFPTGRIHTLREFEQSGAHGAARDHFFHTFNDFFLGLLVLGKILDEDQSFQIPDRYIRGQQQRTGLHAWEALWTLTSLFHDPGYLAEHPFGAVAFALGVEYGQNGEDNEIPPAICNQIDAAWSVQFASPRNDLRSLMNIVGGEFFPSESQEGAADKFDAALRSAYFDGQTVGHSVISALALIYRVRTDTSIKPPAHDPATALIASEIAGLSMIFHDPGCRDKLAKEGISPVPFNLLPYAATLMYVDAIQDDRRDITKEAWPVHGVLRELTVSADKKTVAARVCLAGLPASWWPFKVVEYDSVLKWVNGPSQVNFKVNYEFQNS